MKIEVDTKHDSKEELMHLATMLQALARTSKNPEVSQMASFADMGMSRLDRKLAKAQARSEMSMPSQTSSGFFNLFTDDIPTQPQLIEPQPMASEPSPSPTGDIFSIFGGIDQEQSSTREEPVQRAPVSGINQLMPSADTLISPEGQNTTDIFAMLGRKREEPAPVEEKKESDDSTRLVPY